MSIENDLKKNLCSWSLTEFLKHQRNNYNTVIFEWLTVPTLNQYVFLFGGPGKKKLYRATYGSHMGPWAVVCCPLV